MLGKLYCQSTIELVHFALDHQLLAGHYVAQPSPRVISLFIVLAWGNGWLMLWTLGFYLTHNGQQAAYFLPRTASIWRC